MSNNTETKKHLIIQLLNDIKDSIIYDLDSLDNHLYCINNTATYIDFMKSIYINFDLNDLDFKQYAPLVSELASLISLITSYSKPS